MPNPLAQPQDPQRQQQQMQLLMQLLGPQMSQGDNNPQTLQGLLGAQMPSDAGEALLGPDFFRKMMMPGR